MQIITNAFQDKNEQQKKKKIIFCFYRILYLHVYVNWWWSHHLAQLFQLLECVLLSTRHIVLWIFHLVSVALLSSLNHSVWTHSQKVPGRGTADAWGDADSFSAESVAVTQ